MMVIAVSSSATEPLTVLVESRGGRQRVIGRAAYMLAFLVAEAERINAAYRGSLEFDFDRRSLKPSIHEYYPQVNGA